MAFDNLRAHLLRPTMIYVTRRPLRRFSEGTMKSTKKAPSTLAKEHVYVENLSSEARKRYTEKTSCIGGVDPYKLAKKDGSECTDQLPPTENTDIFAYCVNHGKSGYTLEEFKNFRSLEACRFFVAGFVSDVMIFSPPGSKMTVVTSKVRHSQRMNDPLRPWIILRESGTVESAHCTCMAGLGETCSHIAATLFWITYANQLRERRTVTGERAYWKMPTATGKISYEEIRNINFQSAKSKKKPADAMLQGEAPPSNRLRPAQLPDYTTSSLPPQQRVADFAEKLVRAGQRPAFTTSMQNCADLYRPSPPPPPAQTPASLRALRDVKTDCLNLKDLLDLCRNIFSNISVSKEEAVRAEAETRGQSDSMLWYALQAGRITASQFFDVVHTKPSSPSMSLLKEICHPEKTVFTSAQTTWGLKTEGRAQENYLSVEENNHLDLKCEPSGLMLNPELPYMGASSDGVITCACHPEKGCLEIKCPFKHATSPSILEACTDPDFCLAAIGGAPSLKKTHRYYAQIQCQLHVCGFDYCDFVVFIAADMHIERVLPDDCFWKANLPRANHVFQTAILPELVGAFFSKPTGSVPTLPLSPQKGNEAAVESLTSDSESDSESEQWCYCQEHTNGTLIGCDDQNCKIRWFHLSCLRMKSAPQGSWFCPDCRKTESASTKSKRTKSKKQK